MAQNQVIPVFGYGAIDTTRMSGTDSLGHVGIAHALLSHEDMDRVLTAAPLSLSQSYVDTMTDNDKQYFIAQAVVNGDITTVELLPAIVEDAGDPTDEVHPYGTIWRNTTDQGIWQTPGDGTWVEV